MQTLWQMNLLAYCIWAAVVFVITAGASVLIDRYTQQPYSKSEVVHVAIHYRIIVPIALVIGVFWQVALVVAAMLAVAWVIIAVARALAE